MTILKLLLIIPLLKEKSIFQLPLGYVVQRTEVIDYKLCNNSKLN